MMRPLSSSLIDLVVPGSSITLEQMQSAVKQVESLGFKARVPSSKDLPVLLNSKGFSPSKGWESSVARLKFRHLKKALRAKDSSAIWCVRGGYGSQKLMPFLQQMTPPLRSKLFIGYSDVTVIQVFLNLEWKWPALHFPVLTQVQKAPSLRRFKDLLTGKKKECVFLNLKMLNKTQNYKEKQTKAERAKGAERVKGAEQRVKGAEQAKGAEKNIKSYLTGGNLSLIQSSIGTPWAGSFKNKILFLEDTGERAYRVDRALWQMEKAGVFNGVRALVLGDFEPDRKNTFKVFQSFAERVSFPVISGVPCGHGTKQEALPFLTPCVLKLLSGGGACLTINSPFSTVSEKKMLIKV